MLILSRPTEYLLVKTYWLCYQYEVMYIVLDSFVKAHIHLENNGYYL